MAQLRHPETGCSWDLQQDFASLASYTIEEAYEVVDAIERDDLDDLCQELGDLLLQVVFHARMAEEIGRFDFETVAGAISEKLIRRHPHVFADAVFENDRERQKAWDDAKLAEKREKQSHSPDSILKDVPKNLPAMMQCEKIQNLAAHHGFDWPQTEPVFDKVMEELNETREAWHSGDQQHTEEEVGDLFLVCINLARHLNVNPEQALKSANRKFSRRFQYIEQQVAEQGRSVQQCRLSELDELWDEAKRMEKAK